jgi:hypothetical protein
MGRVSRDQEDEARNDTQTPDNLSTWLALGIDTNTSVPWARTSRGMMKYHGRRRPALNPTTPTEEFRHRQHQSGVTSS